jgi:hypothetical protein
MPRVGGTVAAWSMLMALWFACGSSSDDSVEATTVFTLT